MNIADNERYAKNVTSVCSRSGRTRFTRRNSLGAELLTWIDRTTNERTIRGAENDRSGHSWRSRLAGRRLREALGIPFTGITRATG